MDPDYLKRFAVLEDTHWWFRARRAILLDEMERFFDLGPETRVLDLGCGAGGMLRALAGRCRAAGVDASRDAVQFARERAGCPVHRGSLPNRLPPGLGEFDVILLLDVLEHLQDDRAGMRAAARLCTPGGGGIVTVPAGQGLYGPHDRINRHLRRYARPEVERLVRAAGLRPVLCSYFNALLFPLAAGALVAQNAAVTRKESNFDIRSRWDGLFERVFAWEKALLRRMSLPFGLSVLCVFRKPSPSRTP